MRSDGRVSLLAAAALALGLSTPVVPYPALRIGRGLGTGPVTKGPSRAQTLYERFLRKYGPHSRPLIHVVTYHGGKRSHGFFPKHDKHLEALRAEPTARLLIEHLNGFGQVTRRERINWAR